MLSSMALNLLALDRQRLTRRLSRFDRRDGAPRKKIFVRLCIARSQPVRGERLSGDRQAIRQGFLYIVNARDWNLKGHPAV